MNDWADLKEALNRLAKMAPRQASAAAEERVLTAFCAKRRQARRLRLYSAVAAASLAFAFGSLWFHYSAPPLQTAPAASDGYYAAMAGFVALPYAQSDVPLEETVIVRVNLQTSELGRLGVPVTASNASGKVRADLLIGQDGVARAMRLVE